MLRGGHGDLRQPVLRGLQQPPLIKQVGAGIGSDTQLREDGQLHILGGGLRQCGANLLHIEFDIRHAQRRRHARHPHQAERSTRKVILRNSHGHPLSLQAVNIVAPL